MLKSIKIISDQLDNAVNKGLFNNIWFFIKDFKNYKLQFFIEYKQNENERIQYIIIGELNSFGFKNINGKDIPLAFNSIIDSFQYKSIPPKYLAELVGEETLFDIENPGTSPIIQAGTFEPHKFELFPFHYHIEKNDFSINLPIELLYKIEEAITLELVNNNQLKEYLFKSLFLTFYKEFRFDSKFIFISNIKDEKGYPFLNTFFGFSTFDFFSILKPIHFDILKEANKLLETTVKISSIASTLPKTLFDDLLEIEEKEDKKIGLGLILREYHRLIERLGNYIYDNLYIIIQNDCESIPKELKYELGVEQMLKQKENYKITNLNKFSKLLKFLSSHHSQILNDNQKKEVKDQFIPIVDTFSSFSYLRNIQTHDRIPIEDSVLLAGINAFKTVIRNVYKLFNFLSNNK